MRTVNSFFDSSPSSVRIEEEDKENVPLLANQEKVVIPAGKVQQVGTPILKEREETQGVSHSLSPCCAHLRSRRLLRIRNLPYENSSRQVEREINTEQKSTSLRDAVEKSSSTERPDEQAEFFTHREPTEWFALQREANGNIGIALPLSLRRVKRVIYVFRNRENGRLLIGKTAGSLNKRSVGYISRFNEAGIENKVKKEGSKAFLMDIKRAPENFEVGILHVLKPEEDLDLFESLFIKYKGQISSLYNENGGGGGGSAHSDENSTAYAIPKGETAPFTPVKYYQYARNDEGNIRPQLTPGFKERLRKLEEQLDDTQELAYVIKKMDTQQRYVGVSASPRRRCREHGYAAEYHDPEHDKYDPTRTDGALHPAMAEKPEQFGFGLLPLQSVENIPPSERKNYVLLQGIARVERYLIAKKESLVSQNGFNVRSGGEGPIARRAARIGMKKP